MTDKNFTDEEIIKAVECCSDPCCKCDDCPLYCRGANCSSFELHRYALDLIYRQKAEIERLKGWQDVLKAEKHSLIKAEAYKEFAKRLKKLTRRFHYLGFSLDYALAVETSEIDNLLKEMVGNVSDNPRCSKTAEKIQNTEE